MDPVIPFPLHFEIDPDIACFQRLKFDPLFCVEHAVNVEPKGGDDLVKGILISHSRSHLNRATFRDEIWKTREAIHRQVALVVVAQIGHMNDGILLKSRIATFEVTTQWCWPGHGRQVRPKPYLNLIKRHPRATDCQHLLFEEVQGPTQICSMRASFPVGQSLAYSRVVEGWNGNDSRIKACHADQGKSISIGRSIDDILGLLHGELKVTQGIFAIFHGHGIIDNKDPTDPA